MIACFLGLNLILTITSTEVTVAQTAVTIDCKNVDFPTQPQEPSKDSSVRIVVVGQSPPKR